MAFLGLGLGLIILCVCLGKRRQESKEQPKIEKNEVYGLEDDSYDEDENRIEDINDYYA